MIPIKGLFEAHLSVRDFERTVAFYRDVVGLELGIAQPERSAAFFWVGGRGRSMMGIFGAGSGPLPKSHHVAFEVKLEDVLAAPQRLQSAGLTAYGSAGEPINEPIVFAWMPAASVFFEDPDGNSLEYIAMLPDPPALELGLVSWSEWQRLRQNQRA
jgi:catechol 2,3-dioxygenase-like lactoylglutathione lyase family enzyme